MTQPATSDYTARLYADLPGLYRQADAPLGYPLLRWLSLLGDQAGEVDEVLDRVDRPDLGARRSALADPDLADAAWLPWLAQLVGVDLQPGLTELEQRDAIRFASSGFRAGTKRAVADAARSALTGTKFAQVYDHSVFNPGDGGQWDVLIVTRGTETPSEAAVLAAVLAKGAKPAGVVLRVRSYTAEWQTVEAAYPTWGAIDGRRWTDLEETGL